MQVFNVVQSEIQHQGNVIQSMEANQQHFEAHIQNQTVDFAQQQATVADAQKQETDALKEQAQKQARLVKSMAEGWQTNQRAFQQRMQNMTHKMIKAALTRVPAAGP